MDISEKTVGAHTLDCPPLFAQTVFSGLSVPFVPLQFSLVCPPLCATTVFSGLSAQSRENRRSTQERTTKRKPYGQTRKDNPEKTVVANKDGQSTIFSGLSSLVCPYRFLWVVCPCVPVRFSLDCPFLCAPTVFSGLLTLVNKDGQSRENSTATQGQTTQRKR
jgi:hypothetical protein